MKLFKVIVPYGQYVYAAESKQQLIDYLKENKDEAVCRYDSNTGDFVFMTDEEVDKRIVQVDVPENWVTCVGGYQE